MVVIVQWTDKPKYPTLTRVQHWGFLERRQRETSELFDELYQEYHRELLPSLNAELVSTESINAMIICASFATLIFVLQNQN